MKKILSIVISLFVSFEVVSKEINLYCSLEGKGRNNYNQEWKKVKIQQKISIYENSDSGNATIRDLVHDFVTDEDFREISHAIDGLKFDWLKYNVRVKDDEIVIFTNLTKNPPLKLTVVNAKLSSFSQNIKISRISGLSITKFEAIERIEDLSGEIVVLMKEYSASGECKVNPEKKF